MTTKDNLPPWSHLALLAVIHLGGVGVAVANGKYSIALLILLLFSLLSFLAGARAERTRNSAAVTIARLDCRELIQEHATATWKRGAVAHHDAINDVLLDFDERWPVREML